MAPRPLGDPYSILLHRSIFAKDHRASGSQDVPLITHRPSRESKLIFLGVMKEGTRYIASIEDTDAKRPIWISEGEKLSEGSQVREITLDHLVVEKNGARRVVAIGSSLEGLLVSRPESGSATASVSSSPTAPAATAATVGTGSESSVEEMMRRRRLQEMER